MTVQDDTGLDPEDVGSLATAPVGQATPAERGLADLLTEAGASRGSLPAGALRAMVDRILGSREFCRDTEAGGLLHPRGKIAFRQLARHNSLHVSIGEEDISVHVDRVSPLAAHQSDAEECGHCDYSMPRVLAHMATNLLSTVTHRSPPGGDRKRLEIPTAGPAPDATRPRRIPFTAIDEAVYLLDSPLEPWTLQIEAHLSGVVDERRLRAALDVALRSHPMARARKAAIQPGRSRLAWEVTDTPDVDPLAVQSCPDDAALGRLRDDFYGLAIPLTMSPPLRVRLARHPAGDVLLLAIHHAASDAIGGLGLLASIARAYAGAPDASVVVDPLGVRDLPSLLGPRGPRRRLQRILAAGAEVWRFSRGAVHLIGHGGHHRSGYGIAHHALTRERTRAFVDATRDQQADDLLVSAMHRSVAAWNLEHGEPAGRVTVGLPINLRPGAWRHEVAGNFLCMVPVSTRPADRASATTLLDAVARRGRQVRRRHSAAALVGLLGVLQRALPLALKPFFVVRVTGNPFAPSALVHGLGTADDLDFGDDLGPVKALWFSPPAMMPEGVSVGAVMAGGCLRLALRYRLALWGADEASRFAGLYGATLEQLL